MQNRKIETDITKWNDDNQVHQLSELCCALNKAEKKMKLYPN